MAIILPVVMTASGVYFTDDEFINWYQTLNPPKQADIITAQFQKSVSNDSLAIIISTDDASSLATQQFIDELTRQINETSSITGIENITSVYSILIPALNQTNQGVYLAYNGGNLTYNLLYSVPTIYSNVWYNAYNTTKYGQLVPGLNQTTQGVYTVQENANMTYNLLYSVPAIYLNVWGQTYQATQNMDQANQVAYQQTAATLSQADPAAYTQYTSHLLNAFNTTWVLSFQDPSTQTYTPQQRASLAANITNQQYINNFLGSNATMQAFATALTQTFSLDSYLTNTPDQNNAQLQDFSIKYIANQSGSSVAFVKAAYDLGKTPSTSCPLLLSG